MLDKILAFIPDPEPFANELAEFVGEHGGFFAVTLTVARLITCVLAVLIVTRIAISLFKGSIEPETWGRLDFDNGTSIPLNHFENLIGRSRSCDICIDSPAVSRSHAVLIFDEHKSFRAYNLSRNNTTVNGEPMNGSAECSFGDILGFGETSATLNPPSQSELDSLSNREYKVSSVHPSLTNYLITLFSLTLMLELVFNRPDSFTWRVPICFLLFLGIMWLYFIVFRICRKRGFEIDQAAFFMASIGLAVTVSSEPYGIVNQFLAIVVGMAMYFVLGWWLRDLDRAVSLRWPLAACTVFLLVLPIVYGKIVNGAKNWIYIGGLSIQPSELAKVAFIYAGTATLDRLFARRNLILFIALAAVCAGLLAYMSDFGAALIFFAAFLVIAFIRSGDIATIALAVSSATFAGIIAIKFKPYIAARFSAWGHAWQFAHDAGYQQTRTMSAAASGGLLGLGAGNGWLKYISAADTDLVFGVVCEELGLIVALSAIACIIILTVFAIRSARNGRSTFYTIASVATMSMFCFQIILNVFGSIDLLPLTGVTFPFISNGGSSLMSAFAMLAFVKAADVRRNSGFALRPASVIARHELERSGK